MSHNIGYIGFGEGQHKEMIRASFTFNRKERVVGDWTWLCAERMEEALLFTTDSTLSKVSR